MAVANPGGEPDAVVSAVDAIGLSWLDPTHGIPRPDLIELACADLVRRWRRGQRVPVEVYLSQSPSLQGDDEAVLDLVDCERALRQDRGEEPGLEEYLERFPALGPALRRLFLLERVVEDDSTGPGLTLNDPDEGSRSTLQPGATTAEAVAPPSIPGYVIEGELGRGGMGIVYKARQLGLDRTVAVKMILGSAPAVAAADERFRAEAQAIARLHHPNVVQVHAVGEHDGRAYLVMEFVDGGGLAGRLDGTPWQPRRAAGLVEVLAGGIAAAHRVGVVHRDLKPSNILLADDAAPKIADFGLAKLMDSDSELTRTGALLGSPMYMAPEQAMEQGGVVGPPADIHALGVILYELLTGRPPYRGATITQTLEQVRSSEPVLPSRLVPHLPRDVETICLKCLEKDPERRYGDAGQLADDLRRYLDGQPILARPAGRLARAARWARRRPVVAGLIGALAAAVISLAGLGLWSYAAIRSALDLSRQNERLATEEGDKARISAASEARARRASQEQSASLALDHGIALAESGYVGRGLLWMAHALRLAHADAVDFRRIARANLATWAAAAPLPARRVLAPHAGRIMSVALDPARDLVATADDENVVRVWRFFDARPVGAPLPHDSKVTGLLLGPDGRSLLTVEWDGQRTAKVHLRDLPSCRPRGAPLVVIVEAANHCLAQFRPDGRALFVRDLARIRLYSADDLSPIGRPMVAPDRLARTEFSPDGRLIAAQAEGTRTPWIWDAGASTPLPAPREADAELTEFAFSPDGSRLLHGFADRRSGRERGGARLWDPRAGRVVAESSPTGAVSRAVFRPDGRAVLLMTGDFRVRMHDARDLHPIGPMFVLEGVGTPQFSPDGRLLLVGASGGLLRLWDPMEGAPVGPILEHGGRLKAFAFEADGSRIAVATLDGLFGTWDVTAATGPARVVPHRAAVATLAFSPDGSRLATAGRDGTARVWEARALTPAAPPLLQFDGGPVMAIAFAPGGELLATGGEDTAVHLWERRGRPRGPGLLNPFYPTKIAFSADGDRLLAGGIRGRSRLWDLRAGRPIGPVLEHPVHAAGSNVFALAFGAGGRAAYTGSADGTVIRWDAATGRRRGDLAAGRVSSVPVLQELVADAGGRRLMMVRDGEVLLWDISELEPRLSARFPTRAAAFVLSPDGRRLLTVGDRGDTRLYSADDGRPIGPPLVPDLDLWAGDFLPDGRTVVLGIQPNRIRFYDLASGRPIGPDLTHEGLASVADGRPYRTLRAAPDGRSVASLYNGWIKLWDVPGTIEADDERLVASAEALTGLSIDARGEIAALTPAAWRERLESGDAGLLGRRLSLDDWHDRNAARAELLGPPETALWHLERLGAARPGDGVVRLRLARARESSGESSGAAAGRAAARRLGPDEVVRTWLLHAAADRFRDAARAGRLPEAAAALDEVMDDAPDDVSAGALRGEVRARLGRWSEAAEDLAVAAAAEPANHWFAHFHALTLLAAGDRAGYRAACARVLAAVDPDPDPIAANWLAWACALGPDAVDDFERPIGMVRARLRVAFPDYRRYSLRTLGACLYRAGRYAEAIEESIAFIQGRNAPADWAFLAMAHHRLGRPAEARRWMDRFAGSHPPDPRSQPWDAIEYDLLRREAAEVLAVLPDLPDTVFAAP